MPWIEIFEHCGSKQAKHIPVCLTFDISSFHKQDFAFPDSFIYYITKYPSNSKGYQKLVQTCKYFYNKNPVIILPCLHYTRHLPQEKHKWFTCGYKCDKNYGRFPVNLNGIRRLWITDKCDLMRCFKSIMDPSYSSLITDIIPKMYRCNIQECYLYNQFLNFDQFLFIASLVKKCDLCLVTIKKDNGNEVLLEEIVANLIYLEEFQFDVNDECTNVSSHSAEKLLEIPHVSNIRLLILYDVPNSFNDQILKDYAHVRQNFKFLLKYRPEFAHRRQNRAEENNNGSELVKLYMRIFDPYRL